MMMALLLIICASAPSFGISTYDLQAVSVQKYLYNLERKYPKISQDVQANIVGLPISELLIDTALPLRGPEIGYIIRGTIANNSHCFYLQIKIIAGARNNYDILFYKC